MKKALLCLALAWFAVFSAMAQSRTVTGKVSSAEEPDGIPGVNVRVQGTTIGAITDLDGSYAVNVPEGANVLTFSFVGFLTQEVAIGNRTTIDIILVPDVKVLSEVVVVGYGTQERREVTGSVASINNAAMENLVSPSFESQLAGRAPGVSVTTPGGVLGQRPIIRIRGVNSITSSANPLIVIDGVPVVDSDRSGVQDTNPLANINPSDIASFEVLKDGSATAIYGSRAANGVILITTKRGSTGKAQVSYNVSVGVNKEVERFELLNGDQFVTIANEKRANAGQSENARPGVNTDWQDLVFRNGVAQQHSLSISGGSEATKYFFSLGYSDQESPIKPNEQSRYSFRANVDHSVSSAVRLGTSLSYSYTQLFGLNNGANSLSGAIYNATRALPNVPIYDPENTFFDGFHVTANGNSAGWGNNLAAPDNNIPNIGFVLANNQYRSRFHRVLGSVYGEVDIVEGLTARTQVGVDLALVDDLHNRDPRHGDGRSSNGYMYMAYNPAMRWNWQNTLNYQTIIANDHSLNVTAGLEYQYTNFYNFSASANDFSDRFYLERNLITGSYNNQFSGGGYSEIGYDSYFARLNYSFRGKYLLSLTARRDGISSLPTDNRKGTFPGGSIGWRLSDEAFFNSSLISDLKFRASYAEVGNTEIGSFPYAGGFGPVLGGAGAGIGYSNVANNNLQWESSKKFNIGFDMTLGGVTINADYFHNNIDGLILDAPTAPSLGIPGNKISQNVGSMVNSGLELRLMSRVLSNGSFTWNTDFNFTYLTNEVTELVQPIISTYNKTEEGGPIGQLFGVKWAGVNSANGNAMYYREVEGAQSIVQYVPSANAFRAYDAANPTDVSVAAGSPTQMLLGNTLPKWQGGWSNSFNYKNWDAEIFIRYSGGNYIMNETRRGLLGQGFSNNHVEILERWTQPGQETDVPRLYSGVDPGMWQTSAANSRFVEKGDFVRVQNIVLGYRLPSTWLTSAFNGAVTSARFFGQVQNPFIFTGYSGLDPELNQYTGQLQYGIDWNVAPIIRTWSLGLNVGF